MKITQTAIATVLALVVIAFFFIFGGMSIFTTPTPSDNSNVEITNNAETASTTATTTTTTTTTMPTEPVTQLIMKDDVVGTGAAAAAGDSVTVNYVGSFTNGTVFDASAKHAESANGFTFVLGAGQVIKGWDEGVAGMKVGGKRSLVIPASLGYGPNDYGPIPGNSTLLFDVELLKVQKP